MNEMTYDMDMVVLSADKNMDYSMKGIMERSTSLGIRKINAEFYDHPQHDPGCLREGHNFLRPFINKCHYALVVLTIYYLLDCPQCQKNLPTNFTN